MQVLLHRQFVSVLLVMLAVFSVGMFTGCQSKTQLTRQELVAQAKQHFAAGNYHKALSELNQALAQDPKNVEVYLNLGWIYLYTNQLDKASNTVQQIDRLEPENEKVHYLRGTLYEKLGQWVDALESYNLALKSDVNNPQLHFDIANVFLQLNSPDAALREFNVALKLDAQNPTYEFGRCVAYRQLKQYKEAVAACQVASDLTEDEKEQASIQQVLQTIKLLESLENAPNTELPKEAESALN